MKAAPRPAYTDEEARHFRARGYWGRPTVSQMIGEHAREAPGRLAVVDSFGASLTYGGLEAAVRGACAWFTESGARKGDAVLMAMHNEMDYAVAHLAASRLGLVSVMVSAREGPGEIAYAVEQTEARLALMAPGRHLEGWLEGLAGTRGVGGSLERIAVTRLDDADMAVRDAAVGHDAGAWPGWYRFHSRSGTVPPVAVAGTDTELVVFSSGTTGRPKGIAHTYDGAGASLWNWIRTLGLSWHDPVFCPATFGHVGGSQWGLRTAIATGAPLVAMSRWDPVAAAELIGTYGCTYTLVTPTYVHDLTLLEPSSRAATAGFRFWTVGGSRMQPGFVPEAERALGGRVLRGFGMSEHFMSTITRPDDPDAKRATRDGRALPGVVLQAWDEDGNDVGVGTPGEMVYRGPSLIGGYFTDPLETERTFVDGWQRTGDLVVLDADGFIEVVDRKKEMIIRGGENISPQEIEDVLRDAGLSAFAVVAIPHERLGEQVALVFERREDLHLPKVQGLLARAGVAKYKWPEVLIPLAELPRTPLGKLQRGVLRRIAADMAGNHREDRP